MSLKSKNKENKIMKMNEKKDTVASVGSFIERYKTAIIIVFVVVIVALIAVIATSAISKHVRKSGFEKLDALTVQLSNAQSGDIVDSKSVQDILVKAKDLASSTSGIVSTRAYMFAADIDFSNKNWEYSKESWLNAANAINAYTTPICYYNAAVCAEEMGDMDSAIENYKKAVADESFALAPRGYFNIGRIEQQRGNFAAAAENYTKLTDKFSGNDWANLAETCLISLKAEGKLAN
jgi:tetratricopeptide (TPR) repeat protein